MTRTGAPGRAAADSEVFDVAIVGGGHNALVAAAYLTQAGRSVVALERSPRFGGAAVSARIFDGIDARLSQFAYLVSLFPDRIVSDLGLSVRFDRRPVASCTPYSAPDGDDALLISGGLGPNSESARGLERLTGTDRERVQWERFSDELAAMAQRVAPSLLEPLSTVEAFQRLVDDATLWGDLFDHPIGAAIERRFSDDLVRGIVATDALIGTFADPHRDLAANPCFLYHVIGNGTGEWKVPVGGMGALTSALERVTAGSGARLQAGCEVLRVDTGPICEVHYRSADGDERGMRAKIVLVGASPAALASITGRGSPTARPRPLDARGDAGCQMKLNMVLKRLPMLRSGIDPAVAFAGTFHVNESYGELQRAHRTALAGRIPDVVPFEMYCHTLTDSSILGDRERREGMHTLTAFGLNLPHALFVDDNEPVTREVTARMLAGLDAYLAEPIEGCLARDVHGRPCLEAHSPVDLDHELALPSGNIFHRPLQWPFATGDGPASQAGAWGVETEDDRILLCGAGAVRGGGVSGIPGHNAAKAALERLGAI